MDLGEPTLSTISSSGCSPQDSSCSYVLGACGVSGTCVGGLNNPKCQCEPSWTGPNCDTPTVPVSLSSRSYVKMALSFSPASRVINTQVRVRTRGRRSGLILCLGSKNTKENFSLEVCLVDAFAIIIILITFVIFKSYGIII